MVSGLLKWLLIISSISLGAASVCPQGKQFLHQELQVCLNCTICDNEKGDVVLRPCEVHRDTICGPLSELTLNWKFSHEPKSENRHRHAHHRHHHEAKGPKMHWKLGENVNDPFKASARIEPTEVIGMEVTSTEVPFSSAETLIWDWQAIALTLAVFACILFFLVIALYSLHQAKQWRRLKENFEAGKLAFSFTLCLCTRASTPSSHTILALFFVPSARFNIFRATTLYFLIRNFYVLFNLSFSVLVLFRF